MEKYIVRKKKEYVYCTYNEIIKEIAECVKFFENTDIDKDMNISRFNDEHKIKVIILNDEDFQNYKIIDNNQDGGSICNTIQNNNYIKYLKYKIKYLKLKRIIY
jgi:hypothetical protein